MTIPEAYIDLLEQPVVVSFTTMMPDGQPQATPVWCSYDGTHILVNTAKGRRKDKNVRANPKVAVLAIDPQNPYRYLEVRGEVVEITEEGGVDHINQLAQMYVGKSQYYGGFAPAEAAERETREILKIKPLSTTSMG